MKNSPQGLFMVCWPPLGMAAGNPAFRFEEMKNSLQGLFMVCWPPLGMAAGNPVFRIEEMKNSPLCYLISGIRYQKFDRMDLRGFIGSNQSDKLVLHSFTPSIFTLQISPFFPNILYITFLVIHIIICQYHLYMAYNWLDLGDRATQYAKTTYIIISITEAYSENVQGRCNAVPQATEVMPGD